MLVFIEIWHRRKAEAAYRRHGIEQISALLEAGATMTLKVNAKVRRVTVDRAARTAISSAAVGTLWVTEA
jgi:hypothetical protein